MKKKALFLTYITMNMFNKTHSMKTRLATTPLIIGSVENATNYQLSTNINNKKFIIPKKTTTSINHAPNGQKQFKHIFTALEILNNKKVVFWINFSCKPNLTNPRISILNKNEKPLQSSKIIKPFSDLKIDVTITSLKHAIFTVKRILSKKI